MGRWGAGGSMQARPGFHGLQMIRLQGLCILLSELDHSFAVVVVGAVFWNFLQSVGGLYALCFAVLHGWNPEWRPG